MSIGTTIKRLRRERDITQEELAEYLGISTGAVSQWECDRTAPDITQLPLLANIFEVSADELLEIDGKKKDEIIQVFLEKYDELSNRGDHISKFNMTKEVYEKYPNDYRVIEKYISELFNDPNYPDEPLGETVHKKELYKLCTKVLENCTIQKIRYYATSVLSALYVNDGLIDKAKEICDEFPESVYGTVSEQYEQLYCRCDDDKYIEFIKKNLRHTADHLINKIRNLGMFGMQKPEEKIRAFKKCLELIELIYDDEDYGFSCYHNGYIHCLIARQYHRLGDSENAALHLEKGLHFSKKYDELPKIVKHTSLLLKGDEEDLSTVYRASQMNCVACMIDVFNEGLDIPDQSEVAAILQKYAPYAKKL